MRTVMRLFGRAHCCWALNNLLFSLPFVARGAAMSTTTAAAAAAPRTKMAFYHGRIVATPLPDAWTTVVHSSSSSSSAGTTPQLLPPNKKVSQQQIDPHTVKESCGPLHYQPLSHGECCNFQGDNGHNEHIIDQNDVSTIKSEQAILVKEDESCSITKIDIYLYPRCGHSAVQKTTQRLELNRNSNELVADTLQRIVLNLEKKLQKGQTKKQKTQQPASHAIAYTPPSVWLVGPAAGTTETDSIAPTLLDELDVSKLTNSELWIKARTTPLAVTVHLPSSSDDATNPLCFLIESCPPTVTSVRTFEDFCANLFVGVPVVVQVDTMYATHCRVDWYVTDGKLHQTTWGDSHMFTPDESHVDKEVTLLITPFRFGDRPGDYCGDSSMPPLPPHNGNGCQQAFRFQKCVEPLPENTVLQIRSQWLMETAGGTLEQRANDVRVLTYNILADQNANQIPFYPFVSKEILSKDRRMPLILQEILAYRADVICLQEVDESVFRCLFEPVLTSRQYNYQGYHSVKSNDGSVEGCALFWSLDKFLTVSKQDQKTFAIQDLLTRDYGDDDHGWAESMEDLSILLERRPDLHRVCTTNLGHIVQMCPLTVRPIADSTSSGARPIWITNTHLYFHPIASHLRLIQMFLLARQLGYELRQCPGEVVCCGDFNASLQNSAGKLMVDRFVPTNYRNNKTHLNTFRWDFASAAAQNVAPSDDDFPAVSLPASFPTLLSAVEPTPEFTHYLVGFQGTLDHILVSGKMLCTRSAPMPTVQNVTVATAMPSANLPSDHVSLVCDLTMIG